MKINKIFGPPGTGKTSYLIKTVEEFDSGKFKFLSYTKAAANEALSRLAHGDFANNCSTLHSMAFAALGLRRTQTVDALKLQEYSEATGIQFKNRGEETMAGDDYLRVLSYARNKFMNEFDAYEIFGCPGTRAQFELFLRTYVDWKNTYGYMDFEDMLVVATTKNFHQLDYLVVDESQDLSPLQWALLTRICESAMPKVVYIAGDDDQAIYEWNGASPHGMVNWGDYAGVGITLPVSYRLPDTVHTWVHQHILPLIGDRYSKEWETAKRGGKPVVRYNSFEDVVNAVNLTEEKDVRILARDNYRLREMSSLLSQSLIPHSMIGGFTPWTDVYARAIRGWYKPGNMTPDEKSAIEKLGNCSPEQISSQDWRQVLKMPPHKIDMYEAIGTDILKEPDILLSTVHQAKGAEASIVVVDLQLNARTALEYRNNPDAEARVMYVACTRSKERLVLCAENPLI